MKIGYARVSTKHQDLAAQEDQLRQLGVVPERIYVDGAVATWGGSQESSVFIV